MSRLISILLLALCVWFLYTQKVNTSSTPDTSTPNYASCGDQGSDGSAQRVTWALCASWEATKEGN